MTDTDPQASVPEQLAPTPYIPPAGAAQPTDEAPAYAPPAAPPVAPPYGAQPYGYQPYGTPPGSPAPYSPAYIPASQQTNTLAIISLVTAFFLSLAAVITGHIALSQIKRTGEGGRGLAIAGVVLGYVGLFFGTLYLLFIIGAVIFSITSSLSSDYSY